MGNKSSVLLLFLLVVLITTSSDSFVLSPCPRSSVLFGLTYPYGTPPPDTAVSRMTIQQRRRVEPRRLQRLASSNWGDFTAFTDDDDADEIRIDRTVYAKEEDPQEVKAQVGVGRPAPTIEYDAEPIFVPQGTVLDLSEDTVLGILSACRQEIGTMFGYTAENRGVGITGGVDYVDMDGPTIILRLKGRFWHERKTVLARVGSYLKGRIPEIVDVVIEDEWQLTDEANEQW